MEKFHFPSPFRRRLKQTRAASFCRPPIWTKTNSSGVFRFSHRTKSERKIKYRWKNHSPKKKKKGKRKRFPLASIYFFSSLGVDSSLISSGKICFSYLALKQHETVVSSASYDVFLLECGNVSSVFYLLDDCFARVKEENVLTTVEAIKSKHLRSSDTRDRNQTTIFFRVWSGRLFAIFLDGDNKIILLLSTISTRP